MFEGRPSAVLLPLLVCLSVCLCPAFRNPRPSLTRMEARALEVLDQVPLVSLWRMRQALEERE